MPASKHWCGSLDYAPQDLWDLLVGDLAYRAWKIGSGSEHWEELASTEGILQSNVVFTPSDLPDSLREPWTAKSAVRWAGISAKNA